MRTPAVSFAWEAIDGGEEELTVAKTLKGIGFIVPSNMYIKKILITKGRVELPGESKKYLIPR